MPELVAPGKKQQYWLSMSESDDSLDRDRRAKTRGRNGDEIEDLKQARLVRAWRTAGQGQSQRRVGGQRQQQLPYEQKQRDQISAARDDVTVTRQNAAQFEECRRLSTELELRDREIKECRYEMKQMQTRLSMLQTSEQSWETKISNATSSLKQSCDVADRALEEKKRIVQAECDRLIRLVSGIERHTTHSHHAVASRTTIGLLLKTRHGLENLKRAVVEGGTTLATTSSPSSSSTVDDFGSSALRAPPTSQPLAPSSLAAASAAFGATGGNGGSVRADALDGALLEMCKHLEEENMRLESALAVAQSELEELQRESSASKLIPHYRLAIVRARAHATTLADQLQHEQNDNRMLREQLEAALKEISSDSTSDLRRGAIFDFLNLKSSTSSSRYSRASPTPHGVGASLLSNPLAAQEQAKLVQKDLTNLDAEIATLQQTIASKTKGKLNVLLASTVAM
jgi:hypothetical protein